MLLRLGSQAQAIEPIDDFAQVVAARNLVAEFTKDLADLVFDRVRSAGALLEALQVGKQALVHEVAQVVAGEGGVVIQLAAGVLRRRPAAPAVGLLQNGRIAAAFKGGHGGPVVFEPVEVLEEQQPGSLLGVVELGAAAGFFAQAVIDGAERLLKGAGARGGSGTVGGAGAGSRRAIRQGHRAATAPSGHDQPAAQQLGFDGVVGGLIPLEHFAQAAVAGGAPQGRQGSQEFIPQRILLAVVLARIAQRAVGGEGQRRSLR